MCFESTPTAQANKRAAKAVALGFKKGKKLLKSDDKDDKDDKEEDNQEEEVEDEEEEEEEEDDEKVRYSSSAAKQILTVTGRSNVIAKQFRSLCGSRRTCS